jgi:hypothetical protein
LATKLTIGDITYGWHVENGVVVLKALSPNQPVYPPIALALIKAIAEAETPADAVSQLTTAAGEVAEQAGVVMGKAADAAVDLAGKARTGLGAAFKTIGEKLGG